MPCHSLHLSLTYIVPKVSYWSLFSHESFITLIGTIYKHIPWTDDKRIHDGQLLIQNSCPICKSKAVKDWIELRTIIQGSSLLWIKMTALELKGFVKGVFLFKNASSNSASGHWQVIFCENNVKQIYALNFIVSIQIISSKSTIYCRQSFGYPI